MTLTRKGGGTVLSGRCGTSKKFGDTGATSSLNRVIAVIWGKAGNKTKQSKVPLENYPLLPIKQRHHVVCGGQLKVTGRRKLAIVWRLHRMRPRKAKQT
ncbi:hypothetical protein RRF57_010033 [Xylaria bambusicola]|uniref:Uncharacterized protein n=1 Tax=Xylaria bambusicola TaxID=326684 RepID=A0AAN7V0B2_9PEZI